MTVKEFMHLEKITMPLLEKHFVGISVYWQNCVEFCYSNWHRDMSTMSQKQIQWLTKIQEDAAEIRIEAKLTE